MQTRTYRRPRATWPNYFAIAFILILTVVGLAVPLHFAESSSRNRGSMARSKDVEALSRHSSRWASSILPWVAGESVTLYAADCVTPTSSFSLGQVVCAKTDGVDLSVPGNHYMNWIDSQLNQTNGGTITTNPQFFQFAAPTADTWKATIGRVSPPDSSIVGNPPVFTVSADKPGIGIFAGDGAGGCTNTPKSVFNLQDANKDVCAKVTGGQANQYILWSNAKSELVQNVPLGPGQNAFTLSTGSSLGDWRVILFEPFGGSVYAITNFTV